MKIFQVFESYPLFYQPYIPPVLNSLAEKIDSQIIAFRGSSNSNKKVHIFPSYFKRRLREKIIHSFNHKYKGLNFLELNALKQNVDVIHLQHSFLFNKVITLLNKPSNSRPKIVITLRGGDTYIKPWVSQRWRDFYQNYGHKVDAFVVMSKDQKKYLHRWGIPLERIHVIPISFGEKFEAKPKLPNKDMLKLVSVFRMCWEKNIADNLRLIKQIKETGINVLYDVYGDGKDIGQLYYLVDQYGLNDVVNIKGKVENKIIKTKLREYDFILQLSHSESFGMSLVEAQTYGVPATVSNSGGLKEIIIDNRTGIISKDIDFKKLSARLLRVWQDKDTYYEYSYNSITNSQKNYNIDSEVEKLSSLYKFLLA